MAAVWYSESSEKLEQECAVCLRLPSGQGKNSPIANFKSSLPPREPVQTWWWEGTGFKAPEAGRDEDPGPAKFGEIFERAPSQPGALSRRNAPGNKARNVRSC